jgi:hypothetical protein
MSHSWDSLDYALLSAWGGRSAGAMNTVCHALLYLVSYAHPFLLGRVTEGEIVCDWQG